MPYLSLDGAQIYYEVTGSGPPLIFAHGLGGNHISWWQQVPHFQDRYTCVTFAHRGFAPSNERHGGPGPRAFRGDLAALIDHLGFRDVRLVAQSMGGWSCLDYALSAPERVTALVMAATVGTLSHPDCDRATVEAAPAARALVERGVHPAAGARMAAEQPALHFLYQELDALGGTLDKLALRQTLGELRVTPPATVATLRVPVLCISGEEDVVIPTAAVEVLAGLIPGARLARVPEAGHSVYFERAATFNRLVDDFLVTAP